MSSRKQMRLTRLAELISDRVSLHVRDAAEILGVSEMTIRRDVRSNGELFGFLGGYIVQKAQSGARTPYDLGSAADLNGNEKREVCRRCLTYIQPQDTIFVDCGTTLVHLIDLLPNDIEITLVCYALNIADRAVRKPNINVVLVGGKYHPLTASFSALGSENLFAELAITTGFFSAAGFDPDLGATCANFHETASKKAAIVSSQQKILVIDSSKIGKVQPARYANSSEFNLILTEKGQLDVSEADSQ